MYETLKPSKMLQKPFKCGGFIIQIGANNCKQKNKVANNWSESKCLRHKSWRVKAWLHVKDNKELSWQKLIEHLKLWGSKVLYIYPCRKQSPQNILKNFLTIKQPYLFNNYNSYIAICHRYHCLSFNSILIFVNSYSMQVDIKTKEKLSWSLQDAISLQEYILLQPTE